MGVEAADDPGEIDRRHGGGELLDRSQRSRESLGDGGSGRCTALEPELDVGERVGPHPQPDAASVAL